jgi:hypothetical protein
LFKIVSNGLPLKVDFLCTYRRFRRDIQRDLWTYSEDLGRSGAGRSMGGTGTRGHQDKRRSVRLAERFGEIQGDSGRTGKIERDILPRKLVVVNPSVEIFYPRKENLGRGSTHRC